MHSKVTVEPIMNKLTKIWVTKYALTTGTFTCDAVIYGDGSADVDEFAFVNTYRGACAAHDRQEDAKP